MRGERRFDEGVVKDLLNGLNVALAEFGGYRLKTIIERSFVGRCSKRPNTFALLREVDQFEIIRSEHVAGYIENPSRLLIPHTIMI